MSRVEVEAEYPFMTPDGYKLKEVHERLIREAPEYASSPEWNEREARRAQKRKRMWNWARMVGRNRKEVRKEFRRVRKEYGG